LAQKAVVLASRGLLTFLGFGLLRPKAMPRVGRKRKKKHTEKDIAQSEKELKDTPRCFVLKRGVVGQRVKDLVQDFRMVMMPNCAKSLKESKVNRIEDFTAVAGHYGVSHLIVFTSTKLGTYMKLAKLPQGPTLTFKVRSFSLARTIKAMQKHPRSASRDYTSAPLQVLNGFGAAVDAAKAGERQLTTEMLRGLFPAIDVRDFNQAECRRVALFHQDSEKDSISFRHYSVGRRQPGLQKSVSALLNPSRLPKLGAKEDLADYILGGKGGDGDSDGEDMEATSSTGGKIGVRLTEVGPRLDLQLVKGEAGVMGGAILFHRYLKRTPNEQEVLEQRAKQRRKLKERNDRLDKEARKHNTTLKAKRQKKTEAAAWQSKVADGTAQDVNPEEESGDEGEKGTKKRYHPLGFGQKAGGSTSENTVEFESKPNKKGKGGGKKGKGGGKGEGKGEGKGGKKGRKGGGKGKGGGKDRKGGGGSDKVMNSFNKHRMK